MNGKSNKYSLKIFICNDFVWYNVTHLKSNACAVDDPQNIHSTTWFISELNALLSSGLHNHKFFYE